MGMSGNVAKSLCPISKLASARESIKMKSIFLFCLTKETVAHCLEGMAKRDFLAIRVMRTHEINAITFSTVMRDVGFLTVAQSHPQPQHARYTKNRASTTPHLLLQKNPPCPERNKRPPSPENKPSGMSTSCTKQLGPCIRRGTDVALPQTNDHKNVLVSSDHLPPTSPAITTRRAPSRGTSFLCASWPPAMLHHPRRLPFFGGLRHRAMVTTVASKANWHPPEKVNPSATTSNRCEMEQYRGCNIAFRDTPGLLLPRKSATALSTAKLLCCKLRGGGQGCQRDGHTGTNEHRGATENGGDATREPETNPKRCA